MELANSNLNLYMGEALKRKASDIIISSDAPIAYRVDGKLMQAGNQNLTASVVAQIAESIMPKDLISRWKREREVDFSFGFKNARVRVNAYFQKRLPAMALRIILKKIHNFSELGLPPILEKFSSASQGLFLVTGPTGHGKSTTLASMIDYINQRNNYHIITIEDPIEYVFENRQSIISQREVGVDTHSFSRALRACLREDPNVILVGEMRDLETIDAVLTLSETGHLVLATLHTNSASQTADRIIDVFPPHRQQQVRQQLASILLGIVSQRLIPKVNGGRILGTELLIANPAVRSLIREGKNHQLPNVIATSAADGMISLDKVLADLVSKGEITIDHALTWAIDPKSVKTMIY